MRDAVKALGLILRWQDKNSSLASVARRHHAVSSKQSVSRLKLLLRIHNLRLVSKMSHYCPVKT